jgi:beta-mannosidase
VHARPAKTSDYEMWVVSSKMEEFVADVELRYVSIATGREIKRAVVRKGVNVVANGTTEVFKGTIDNLTEESHVLAARIWVDGVVVARDTDWPQPFKYLDFADRGLEVVAEGSTIRVSAKRPTKGLVFEERQGILVDDSAIDVVPGDEQVIKVTGLGASDEKLKWTYLGKP